LARLYRVLGVGWAVGPDTRVRLIVIHRGDAPMSAPSDTRYTAADGLIDALADSGVSCCFANFGSDHPPLIEALARGQSTGRNRPQVLLCPHETVALSAAHGHAMVSGQAQAVFVHCDVGTQTMGGAVHNVARARMPVFIFAGETSVTLEGERFGSRNRAVQFIQDVKDQHSIVRPYVKWSYPMRTHETMKQLTYRGMQVAQAEPSGPIYLSAPREILEEEIEDSGGEINEWPTPSLAALGQDDVQAIAEALASARHPVIAAAYLGRDRSAPALLAELCERLGVAVVEPFSSYLNLSSEHPCHLGDAAEPLLEDADVILVIDCDVPWVPVLGTPKPGARIFHIDRDTLKTDLPLWHFPAHRIVQAEGATAIAQLLDAARRMPVDEEARAKRLDWIDTQRTRLKSKPREDGSQMNAHWLSQCVADVMSDDTLLLNESITNSVAVQSCIPRTQAGTYFHSGGSSLGWHGGAAIGAKLAAPERDVVAVCGDGTYMLSVPSTVHWVASRYQTPFLTVIYNNGGWNATKQNTSKLYPDGDAVGEDRHWVNLRGTGNLADIAAAAGGAFAATVEDPAAVPDALAQAMREVRGGRAAVVDVRLPPISEQAT